MVADKVQLWMNWPLAVLGPRLGHGFNHRPGVLLQLLRRKGRLANRHMHIAPFVHLEFDAARP